MGYKFKPQERNHKGLLLSLEFSLWVSHFPEIFFNGHKGSICGIFFSNKLMKFIIFLVRQMKKTIQKLMMPSLMELVMSQRGMGLHHQQNEREALLWVVLWVSSPVCVTCTIPGFEFL